MGIRDVIGKYLSPPDANGCVIWTGYVGTGGYGEIAVDRKKRSAFKVMYELFIGPIPKGLEPDHLCRVRKCVNPSHLEPVTKKVNIMRGVGKPTMMHRARLARGGGCSKGHHATSWDDSHYHCRECFFAYQAAYREANADKRKAYAKAYGPKYYQANKERISARRKARCSGGA